MSRTPLDILASLLALGLAVASQAGTVQVQLGEQDFADGKTPVYSREIRTAGAGEAFPFDGTVFGNDVKPGMLGAFDYTHTIDLAGGRPVSATLTVGLIDIDSPADHPLDTVSLTFDGIGQPTSVFTGISAMNAKSSVEVIDIPVPIEMLADGALHVAFAAKQPGYANLGNAIEADFSRLTVEFDLPVPTPIVIPDPGPGPQVVPLPPVLLPAGLLITGIAAMPKRRLRRWLGL